MAAKKRKLYVDSSIFGFSVNPRMPQWQAEAKLLLRQIRGGHFVGGYSFVTEREISAAPPRLAQRLRKKITWARMRRIRIRSLAQVHQLAGRYCRAHVIPREYFDDALHVAVATLWRADALVSYNFTHLVRLETVLRVNAINRREELAEIVICQPNEVIIS